MIRNKKHRWIYHITKEARSIEQWGDCYQNSTTKKGKKTCAEKLKELLPKNKKPLKSGFYTICHSHISLASARSIELLSKNYFYGVSINAQNNTPFVKSATYGQMFKIERTEYTCRTSHVHYNLKPRKLELPDKEKVYSFPLFGAKDSCYKSDLFGQAPIFTQRKRKWPINNHKPFYIGSVVMFYKKQDKRVNAKEKTKDLENELLPRIWI